MAVVTGKRKREVDLVVLAELTGRTKNLNIVTILYRDFEKKKEKCSDHFELSTVKYNRKMHSSIL